MGGGGQFLDFMRDIELMGGPPVPPRGKNPASKLIYNWGFFVEHGNTSDWNTDKSDEVSTNETTVIVPESSGIHGFSALA